jgi:hypothetical protein
VSDVDDRLVRLTAAARIGVLENERAFLAEQSIALKIVLSRIGERIANVTDEIAAERAGATTNETNANDTTSPVGEAVV